MAEVETLTTVWDARFDKLEQKLNAVIRANQAAASKIEASWGNLNDKIDASFARSAPGLRDFGAASLAAGAGAATATAAVTALVGAFAKARQAASFSAELKSTAVNLHLTTDALQEYQYALVKAGGEEKGVEAALEKFSETLGRASAGVKQSLRPFQELFGKSFSAEDVKRLGDADQAILKITDAVKGLSNTQKDAILKRLGLSDLSPLIDQGVDGMQQLRREAQQVGAVMDSELVNRGAELNKEFDTLSKVIDIQLKSALVDLAPILTGLLKLMADLARAAANVVDAFRDVESRTNQGVRREIEELKRQRQTGRSSLTPTDRLVGAVPIIGPVLAGARQSRRAAMSPAQVDQEIVRLEGLLATRRDRDAPAPVAPTRSLENSTNVRTRRGRADRTVQRLEQVEQAELAVEQQLLSAWSGLLVGANARAEIAKLILDVEKDEYKSRIDKQIADIKTANDIDKAVKPGLIARLEGTKLEQEKVDALRRELIDRELAEQKARDALDVRQSEFEAQEDAVRLAESLVRTVAERRDLELKLLDLADQRIRAEQEAVLASKTSTEADKQIARNKLASLETSRPDRETQVREGTRGPLEQFVADNSQTAAEEAERFQALAANAFDSLSEGLAQAILNAESLGDVAKNVFRQMIADLLAAQIKRGLTSLVTSFIPGFASGTMSAPGGLAYVHKDELVNLPKGSQVMPSHAVKAAAALSNLRVPQSARGGDVQLNVTVNASGAIPREEIEGMVRRGSLQAVSAARQLATTDARKRQYHDTLNAG